MNKFFHKKDLKELMEGTPVTYFGCPFYLNIDFEIINYISNQMIWNAPYKALIFTNSHLFTLNLFDKIKSDYESYSYKYDYDNTKYCFLDKSDRENDGGKGEIQLFNFSSKKALLKKVRRQYYDRVFFHFVDQNIAPYLEQVATSGKALSFFTLDEPESLYYQLNENDPNFYRLYDEASNVHIENLDQIEVLDSKVEQMVKGFFEKKQE